MPTEYSIFYYDAFWVISVLAVGILFLLWNRQQTLATLRGYQERLHESQTHLAAILDSSPESAALMDENGIIIAANQVFGQRLGYDSAALIGRCAYDLIPPELVERRKAHLAHALRTGQPAHFEDQRGERWISHYLQPIRDADGIARQVAIFGADITERKRMDEMLRESEARFRTLAQLVPVGLYQTDTHGHCQFANARWLEMAGMTLEDALGDGWAQGLHTEDREYIWTHWQRMIESGGHWGLDYRFQTPQGQTTWVRGLATALHDESGQLIGYLGANMDITERKRMEDEVRHALAEKETLLREVHHRVKNNLASIIGLLELQQSRQTESDNIALLAELGNRIRSMALVHEMLYQSGTLAWIDFSAYLRALVDNLRDAFKIDGGIEVKVIADKVLMDLEVAIPCGLIVNELVVNAFKYAFPDHQPRSGANACEISITISQDNAAYHLMVADNGVGLPDDVDWKTTQSLGLQLVRMLGRHQLQGQLELDRSHGVCFSLRFCSKRPAPAE